MMSERVEKAVTLLEAVKESLDCSGQYNTRDATAPAAILWTDSDGEWAPIVTQFRLLMPELSFNLAHSQKVAMEKYSHGLPTPFSSDTTQMTSPERAPRTQRMEGNR